AIRSANCGIALAHEKFLHSRHDGFKRWTRCRSAASRPRQQSRIQNRDGEFATYARSKDRRRHLGRGRLRIALCHFPAPEQTIAARLEKKIPETGTHSNWTATSKIKQQTSNIARWLHSFPTAQLKPRQLGGNSP